MGTTSSVGRLALVGRSDETVDSNKSTYGDRVEVTRSLPIDHFGKDDARNDRYIKDVQIDRGVSTDSTSEREGRSQPSLSQKKGGSKRSLRSLFVSTKNEASLFPRDSCSASEALEAAKLKLETVHRLKNSFEAENNRLKKERTSLNHSNNKWRNESEKARQDEKQALLRAENLEKELDRVRRQFKCYRDGKEKELRILLKKCYQLENVASLSSGANVAENTDVYPAPCEVISPFDNDSNIENVSLFKEPATLETSSVPDYNCVFPLLTQVMGPNLRLPSEKRTFKLFLSTDVETRRDAKYLKKVFLPKLQELCEQNSKFLVVVESCVDDKQPDDDENWKLIQIRKCDLFLGMLRDSGNGDFLNEWKRYFHVFNEKKSPVIFCVKNDKNNSVHGGTELTHFIDYVAERDAKVTFYSRVASLVEENDEKIRTIIKTHFQIPEVTEHASISDEELIADWESSFQQCELLHQSAVPIRSDAVLTKYYTQLTEYVSGAGPSPPLFVSGAPGAGKTTLLANWISTQLSAGENVVLYHFVGDSSNDSSTCPVHAMRRIASQLLGLVPCLCSMLHCDPVKCEDYFPRLLETVPSRVNTTIVIVIDGIDKFQNAATCSYLSWLNDPLPATVRVILSVTDESQLCRSKPALKISPLRVEESCQVLVSHWSNSREELGNDQAAKLLEKLPDPAIGSPLFLAMLSHELCRSSNLSASIHEYSSFENVVELTKFILKSVKEQRGRLVNQVLAYVCCSRHGLAESELMEILSLPWSEWAPVLKSFVFDRPILVENNGLLVVSHEQILKAILSHLSDEDILRKSQEGLAEYYFEKLRNGCVSHRVVDQLPWLLEKLEKKDELLEFLSRVDVFQTFYRRSLYSELLGYWKYLGVETAAFGSVYFEAIKKSEGATPLETSLLFETLGRFLKGLNAFPLAMKCLERSLEMKEMVVEPDDPLVGQSLHYLADLYVLLGNLESAESLYKQTLEINKGAFGKDHPLVAKGLECLAFVKKKQNRDKACTDLLRTAAKIRLKSVDSKTPVLSWLNYLDPNFNVDNLGTTGRVSPELASSLHNLGVIFLTQKMYQEAETVFKKSLVMRESLLGKSDPSVSQSLDSLASLYYSKKMYSEAICHYERSLDVKQKTLDAGDPNLISTVNRYAMALRKNGNLEHSETTYRRVLEALQSKHDSGDPVIATALHDLAVVLSEQQKFDEALEYFNEALEIYENTLGSNHFKVAETSRNLAKVHLDLGNRQQASVHLRKAQMIQENDLTVTSIHSQSLASIAPCTNDPSFDSPAF